MHFLSVAENKRRDRSDSNFAQSRALVFFQDCTERFSREAIVLKKSANTLPIVLEIQN